MYIEESVPRLANAGIIDPRVPNLRTILAANQSLFDFGQFTVPKHAQHRGRPRKAEVEEDKYQVEIDTPNLKKDKKLVGGTSNSKPEVHLQQLDCQENTASVVERKRGAPEENTLYGKLPKTSEQEHQIQADQSNVQDRNDDGNRDAGIVIASTIAHVTTNTDGDGHVMDTYASENLQKSSRADDSSLKQSKKSNKQGLSINERLIVCVREREYLYNTQHKMYNDEAVKLAAWETIANEMKLAVWLCKKTWSKLYDIYVNVLAGKKSKTKFKNQLQFLRPFIEEINQEPKQPETDPLCGFANEMENIEISAQSVSEANERVTPDRIPKIEEVKKETEMPEIDTTCGSVNEIAKNEKHMPSVSDANEQVTPDCEREEDDLEEFFESLMTTMKNLPKREQTRLKIEMVKLVIDAELKCLDVC